MLVEQMCFFGDEVTVLLVILNSLCGLPSADHGRARLSLHNRSTSDKHANSPQEQIYCRRPRKPPMRLTSQTMQALSRRFVQAKKAFIWGIINGSSTLRVSKARFGSGKSCLSNSWVRAATKRRWIQCGIHASQEF